MTPTGGVGGVPDGVTAVVLTHLRPTLAGDVTRALLDVEGFPPDRVIVVVNGDGGLDDPVLEDAVRMVRLDRNIGPAGGFRAGLDAAFADPATRWAYLCEDDIGLFALPSPRVAEVLGSLTSPAPSSRPVGAVVAYGRRFVGRGAHTVNTVPEADAGHRFEPVDVACWGATLVARPVVDAGILPDPSWFFGLEDFDFFCRVREAGFAVVVDGVAAAAVADEQSTVGRQAAIDGSRPGDADEGWRAYYHERNSLALVRRHGRCSWYLWDVAYAARHLQVARTRSERTAVLHGVWDGIRHRSGEHPRYRRHVGEWPARPGAGGT